MIKVMSSGVFDVLNLGHINVLTEAKKLGDKLIVGIQDDSSVKKYKNRFPILDINERVAQIKALPFVDDIIIYSDIDQRQLWDQVGPNIIVQGDDYIHSGDRTEALHYLKEKNIRLVLLPRTQGISSSEIKKRIIHENRKDLDHLKNINLLKISDLNIYEEYDIEKVKKLKDKIHNQGVFTNPIYVGIEDQYKIVVDGNNRLQALVELGCTYVPCLMIPYREIDLTNNVHYINNNKVTRLSEFCLPIGKKVEFEKYDHDDIINLIKTNNKIPSGQTWHRMPFNIINFKVQLNKLYNLFDLQTEVNNLIESNNIRFYPNATYTCDEWI